jgi:hypothetical protein
LSSSASFFTIAATENRAAVCPETGVLLMHDGASVVIAILPQEYSFSSGFRAYRFITLRETTYFT